ncbi:MAG: fimbria/pilus periplasmic chaperone [Myxococcales bacterium]|nr:MAG: fimbria/pilus periplasmic chaperone [Myxococcales bacterium]
MRQTLLTLLACAAASIGGAAHASTFNVNPTRLDLKSVKSSAMLALRNTSNDDLRFQIEAFEWKQSLDGKVELKPTQDVIFFPRILSIDAGKARNIRVGLNKASRKNKQADNGALSREKTYRIIVQELPSRKTKQDAQQIQILTRMSIPIFVAPKTPITKVSLGKATAKEGCFSFDVKNEGNVHTMMGEVLVKGLGPSKQELFSKTLPGWYVLAKDKRRYEVELPKALCSKTKSLEVLSSAERSPLALSYSLPPEACHAQK